MNNLKRISITVTTIEDLEDQLCTFGQGIFIRDLGEALYDSAIHTIEIDDVDITAEHKQRSLKLKIEDLTDKLAKAELEAKEARDALAQYVANLSEAV